MTSGLVLRRLLLALAVLAGLSAAFAAGFLCCLKFRHVATPADVARMLAPTGDAPPAVRAGVLSTLRVLQQAYLRRDPNQLDTLLARAFAPNADVLVLGTEGAPQDWQRGPASVRWFIEHDWRTWGLLRFDPEQALVWSSGNVAWVATLGQVEFPRGARRVRITAVLENRSGIWVFRQLQFQWADDMPTAHDLFEPGTYLSLLRKGLRFSSAHP